MSLEQELERAEKLRRFSEEKKRKQAMGLTVPGSSQETLAHIASVRETLANALDGQAFQKVSQVLDLAKTLVEAKVELKTVEAVITGLQTTFDGIMLTVSKMDHTLAVLASQLTDELKKQDEQRELERETLDKLNQYLDNWG